MIPRLLQALRIALMLAFLALCLLAWRSGWEVWHPGEPEIMQDW